MVKFVFSLFIVFSFFFFFFILGKISLIYRNYFFKIIQQIRDEAHRFSNTRLAIRYKNDSLKTQLENIPGIGKARAKFLLDTYGSVEKIKTLSQEELAKLPQIGDRLAENLYRFFHQYNQE